MKRCVHISMALAAVWLTGCVSLPEYRPTPSAQLARLNLKGKGEKLICLDGQRHRLVNDGSGYADIPAGRRVSLEVYYSFQQVYSVTTCQARSSIVPVPGQKYYVDFEIDAERCYALVFKEDASKRTGLVMEPTLTGAPVCKAP